MSRQDRFEQQKPCYDGVQQKTINFILCLTIGITGGFKQGSNQGKDDLWIEAPASLIGACNYLLFGGSNAGM